MLKYICLLLLLTVSCKPEEEKLSNLFTEKNNSKINSEINKNISKSDSVITIIAVGDIMLGSAYPSNSYLAPKMGINLLDSVKSILQNADLTFGNLEGSIVNDGGPEKECTGDNQCYFFRMNEISATTLKSSGFDFLNIGNNHISDFGYRGISNTMRILDSVGIKYSGEKTKPAELLIINGLKIGIVGFGANSATINLNDMDTCAKIVKEFKTKCDILIVSLHAGGEGTKFRHIYRENEVFLGEKRGNPYEFSRAMIDAGADLILGHGPHLSKAVDLYKNRFIAYSMGNFCTYKQFNLSGLNGIAPILKIQLKNNGELISCKVISIKQINRGIPVIDSKNRAFNEIFNLTKTDIPEAELEFNLKEKIISIKK